MQNAIEVKNLMKKYKGFSLDGVSFNVPSGYITGFIGQNGAGKTTTLKLMLNMVLKDGGDIEILGKSNDDISFKEDLGALFDQPYFQEDWTPADIEKALRPFYRKWDSEVYHSYLKKFSLDAGQKFKTFSRGMKMKLGMAAALSHDAKLLLLDEPTSGLDPVMRDEMLDILQDYLTQENKTVLFSTHVTGDLEKIADYIIYIHKGRIVYTGLKDELIEKYCLIRGRAGDLPREKRESVIGLREDTSSFEGMIEVANLGGFPSRVVTEPVNLDDIMIHINKEDYKNDC
ncbi:MAG: ABC transporter ATP-binding protein [Defluviitaleaceae bacterium]|nr:ABC transporter ATP-binding protein [Defluviitaleaceae bacterium]MCL2836553.1 ABC transporter ATP-binding protein [Defluviitaleaceae bacterium]